MRKPRRKVKSSTCEQRLVDNLDISLAIQNLINTFIESDCCTSCCLHHTLGILVRTSDLDLGQAKYVMECVLEESFAPPEILPAAPNGGYIN